MTTCYQRLDLEPRRTALEGNPTLNAIDWIDVADLQVADLTAAEQAEYAALPANRRDQLLWQRKLTVHVVNPLTAQQQAALTAPGILIEGGQRITGLEVAVLQLAADRVVLRASQAGDAGTYTLRLVRSAVDPRPPRGFDPLLATIEFSFKVDCPSEFDCLAEAPPEPGQEPAPAIDYLAKDYASFRRVILDRLSLLVPDWRDRTPADLGVALVELFAYLGDRLSYTQDAIATEAYLGTARRRTSVRRHALLVDYRMHDGCNARTWASFRVSADVTVDAADLRTCTRLPGLPPRLVPAGAEAEAALVAATAWFEPVTADLTETERTTGVSFFADHNELSFHTWGFTDYALATGATAATLAGHHPDLTAGTVLLLAETVSPATGLAADADPRRRHPVRLTAVTHTDEDGPLADPLTGAPITQISWEPADALPFDLCLAAAGNPEAGVPPIPQAAAAYGNVLLVDHGLRVGGEALGVAGQRRYRPRLAEGPLTQVAALSSPRGPASLAVVSDPRGATPALTLASVLNADSTDWSAARDLLDAAADDPFVVVETEADGIAGLRFGRDGHGRAPRPGEEFTADYRVGNGSAGNIGADSLGHVVSSDARIVGVRNPLPAIGGTEPESIAEVRRRAPQAFRTQERAVTPADYADLALRLPAVQRAAATLRWTGSWHTVFLTVDPAAGGVVSADLAEDTAAHLERFRLAGQDLLVNAPRYVSLELGLAVCVEDTHFRTDVHRRLLDVLSSRVLADGSTGMFHPDRFSFGQTVHLSPLIAAARQVPGVALVTAVRFGRQGEDSPEPLTTGRIGLGRLEIARLDNDPNFPEHGVLTITLRGGK